MFVILLLKLEYLAFFLDKFEPLIYRIKSDEMTKGYKIGVQT